VVQADPDSVSEVDPFAGLAPPLPQTGTGEHFHELTWGRIAEEKDVGPAATA